MELPDRISELCRDESLRKLVMTRLGFMETGANCVSWADMMNRRHAERKRKKLEEENKKNPGVDEKVSRKMKEEKLQLWFSQELH